MRDDPHENHQNRFPRIPECGYWRAVCWETRKHGSEGGGWKRTPLVALGRKNTNISRTSPAALCVELPIVAFLLQEGEFSGNRIRVSWLTHDRKVRGTTACQKSGDRSRQQQRKTRKTRMARSRLDCLKSNPDRPIRRPITKLAQRDVTVCRPL
jgi:hypothetical protein